MLELAMSGVHEHLETTDDKLRMVAMVTGEVVTDLATPGDEKLRFEFDADESGDDVVTKLRHVFECPVQGEVGSDVMDDIALDFKLANFILQKITFLNKVS